MLGVKANNHIVIKATMSQDQAKWYCLSNEEWQQKNTVNISTAYSFVPLFTIFLVGIYVIDLKSIFYWLAAPAGLRSWDLKIKAEFANFVSAPPAHSGQLGCTVSRKEEVGGGTSNQVPISLVKKRTRSNKFRYT